MSNVIDFKAYKQNREMTKLMQEKKALEDLIRIEVTPEQLRKIATSLEQIHISHVRESNASKEPLNDYALKISVSTVDKKPVTLVWYPMR